MNQFVGPILIERVAHLLRKDVATTDEQSECANLALQYWCSVGQPNTPYLQQLIAASKSIPAMNRPNNNYSVQKIDDKNSHILIEQKAISHNFADAISLLEATDIEPSNYFLKLEKILELLILGENWRSIEEIEHRLDGHMKNTCHDISPPEKDAYQRAKLLVSASYFLQGRYFECLKHFINIAQNDESIIRLLIAPMSRPLVTSHELILMISLSILTTIPLDSYETFFHLEELEPFFERSPILIKCLNLLINTSYNKFFKLMKSTINDMCEQSMFLDRQWDTVQSIMRNKVYFFYMRIANKVEIKYLSDTLGIDYDIVNREVNLLISETHLNFNIEGDIICFRSRKEINNILDGIKKTDNMLSGQIETLRKRNEAIRNFIQQSIIDNSTMHQAALIEEGMNVEDIIERTDYDSSEDVDHPI
ncbi:LAFE_0B04412g1_1 [Lachancea fermentati]|uniref:LAFE_0B04412g1_1 n=1 Tax=Lachancea fermentati TaxID=4955 RepID=A0A1G4M7U2_LACFM|nr:LAFE_0B04412g1_1 [Lachancea fermentati]